MEHNEHEIFKIHTEIYEAVPYSIKQAVKTHRPRKTPTGGTPRERGQNYISDVMTRFRSFIIWANDNGNTTNNPFKGYSVGESVYGTPIYISNDERKMLYEADLSATPSLAVQRDVFVFQCLIGCRVSDLYKFTWKNLINKKHKRQYRELKDDTKMRISQSLTGRSKSPSHAKAISQGMQEYWQTVPSREAGDTDNNKKSNPQNDETM